MRIKFCSAVFIFLFGINLSSFAQQCDQFPADCPNDGEIQQAEDSSVCITNLIFPVEISMQNLARDVTDTLLNQFAKKNNWQIIKLDEEAASGSRDGNGNSVPEEKRRPHKYEITYEFIVNADSLSLWKKWINDFANGSADQFHQYQNNIALQQNVIQQYSDSMTYYTTLAGQNATDQNRFTYYMNKANAFSDKINSITNSPQTQQINNSRDDERTARTIQFHDGSIFQVTVSFNNYLTENAGEPISTTNISGVTLLRNYYNAKPDMNDAIHYFTHSKNMTLILLGAWQSQTDQYGSYHATFELNGANTDAISVKKTPSYKIQNIDIHLSGNRNAIQKFLQEINLQKLNALILK
jgi:hypothetical protein